ncbi:carcinoembryonic antigen-related cell adhesion molecule 21-like isoform X3 [Megalobrama amblycephala]|uniref:carcinoembryonic antigen-related cell adhesion molecule 21-like isoform X3 n=1 Tax=Megalobrama amblycephala TaxID=75352 RepID=UPI002013C132|nr:carcinoembryonic antigen-related cell adhesion molecule 21-like isoform X3 [Megalobrama amblycephala]
MIFQYNLILMFLCGFAALSVSTETCGKDLLVGASCIIKLRTKNNEKPYEIKWTHDRNGNILRWRDGRIKAAEGVSKEEDGSLRFQSVSLKDTGTYEYRAFNTDGTEIGQGKAEIKVYEKVPKPTVKINCTADGNAALTCDVENSKDPSLTVSWYEDGKLIQNEKNPQVFLSSTQVQENKTYSCETHNPVSRVKSESVTVSCPGLDKPFSLDLWSMVSILAGGEVLLLLLICFLIIYVCCRRQGRKNRQQDEEEFRLADLTPGHTDTERCRNCGRTRQMNHSDD